MSIAASLLVIILSLNIKKLNEVKATKGFTDVNPDEYAKRFWAQELPGCIRNATEISQLVNLLKTDPQKAFNNYSHQLGISQTFYFMVKGFGKIVSVEEEYLKVEIDERISVQIATDFIFGNAVRDGSGKVNIDDFLNMTNFNNVSIAINKLVKDRVVAPLRAFKKSGMLLEFVGATEICQENMDLNAIRIIPISIIYSDGKTK